MDSFQISDTGAVRKLNEDCCGSFVSRDGRVRFYIIADGMGGHLAGEVASAMAVELFGKAASYYEYTCRQDLEQFLISVVAGIDSEIGEKAAASQNCSNMGTTAVIYAAAENYGIFCNVGDSRGYVISRGAMRQITRDHSLVQSMIDNGYIFDNEEQKSHFSNAITKALGFLSKSGQDTFCDLFTVTPAFGDIILLCSDGLTNMLSDSEILNIAVSGKSLSDIASSLVKEANAKGGDDNITVSLLRYGAIGG